MSKAVKMKIKCDDCGCTSFNLLVQLEEIYAYEKLICESCKGVIYEVTAETENLDYL